MPKKNETQPWADDEINKFLSSRGHAPATPGAEPNAPGSAGAELGPGTAGTAPGPGVLDQIRSFLGAGDAPTGRQPTYGEMDWQQAAGQGALRETANLGIGAARLAGQVLPGSVRKTLGQAAQSIPGVSRLQEFADAPAEGPAEYLGSGAVDLATGGAMPAFRLGDAAAAMLPKATPIFAGGGRGFRAIANPTAAKIARYGGDVGETAAKGALGGAVANPDDPMTGAMAGGGAALGGRALGAGLRTHTGQEIGGALSRYGIPTGVGYAVGGLPGAAAGGGLGAVANQVGGAARHTAHRYYSPLGQRLDRFGRAVFDSTGRFLGYMPATAGIAAGRASGGGVQRGRETMYPPTYPHEESEPNAEPGPAQRQ